MSPSGIWWRCSVIPVSNVLAVHGALAAEWDDRYAHYTGAANTEFFGWTDAADDDPDHLAVRILERFPALADEGRGADPAYEAWFAEMLSLTAGGALPCAMSDYAEELEDAAQGILATTGPPPLRPIPMPPPGEAEPAEWPSQLRALGPVLSRDLVGGSVVVFDASRNGEILATVARELPPVDERSAPRYELRLQDDESEPTIMVAGASGHVPKGRGRVARLAEHPVDLLFAKMEQVSPYPPGTEPVRVRIEGTAFFPGGSGLWRPEPRRELPQMPRGMIMVVGQDFYTKHGYLKLRQLGEETRSQTWQQILKLLSELGIGAESCFFTNVWMGLRTEGRVIGRYAGARDAEFTARCAAFLERQVAVQRPRVIVALGRHVPPILARLAPRLEEAWVGCRTLRDLDARGVALVRDVCFPGATDATAHVVALTHPCFRHANARHRRYTTAEGLRLAGHAAEVRMLGEALQALRTDCDEPGTLRSTRVSWSPT